MALPVDGRRVASDSEQRPAAVHGSRIRGHRSTFAAASDDRDSRSVFRRPSPFLMEALESADPKAGQRVDRHRPVQSGRTRHSPNFVANRQLLPRTTDNRRDRRPTTTRASARPGQICCAITSTCCTKSARMRLSRLTGANDVSVFTFVRPLSVRLVFNQKSPMLRDRRVSDAP